MSTTALNCANCNSGELVPFPNRENLLKCMNCRSLNTLDMQERTHTKLVSRDEAEKLVPELDEVEQQIEEMSEEEIEDLVAELPTPTRIVPDPMPDYKPQPKTFGQRLWSLFVKIFWLGVLALLGFWWWNTHYYDADIDSLGNYEIPPIVCAEGEGVIVAYGYRGEQPFLYSYVGSHWEISEEQAKFIEANAFQLRHYLWVYCENDMKAPSYTASGGHGSIPVMPIPQDGVIIVMRGTIPTP